MLVLKKSPGAESTTLATLRGVTALDDRILEPKMILVASREKMTRQTADRESMNRAMQITAARLVLSLANLLRDCVVLFPSAKLFPFGSMSRPEMLVRGNGGGDFETGGAASKGLIEPYAIMTLGAATTYGAFCFVRKLFSCSMA